MKKPAPKIPMPTAMQAQAFWLSALGLNSRQIGEKMRISAEAAQSALVHGRRKAEAVKLKISVDLSAVVEPQPVGSGMSTAMQLAKEAGLV